MNVSGKSVSSRRFGRGNIVKTEGKSIYIDFFGEERVFTARAFKMLLTADDPAVQDYFIHIAESEEKNGKKAEQNRLKARYEEQIAELRAQAFGANKFLFGEFIDTLRGYGFTGFLHTTEYANFIKIYKSGYIKPRSEARDFIDVADKNVIENTGYNIKDCTRFYYFPLTPTNYKANYRNPVMLVCNESLALSWYAMFADGNAAGTDTRITRLMSEALAFPWEEIAERGSYYESVCGIENTYERSAHLTRVRNAEFLYEKPVPLHSVKQIVFKYRSDLERAERELGRDKRFTVNRSVFY